MPVLYHLESCLAKANFHKSRRRYKKYCLKTLYKHFLQVSCIVATYFLRSKQYDLTFETSLVLLQLIFINLMKYDGTIFLVSVYFQIAALLQNYSMRSLDWLNPFLPFQCITIFQKQQIFGTLSSTPGRDKRYASSKLFVENLISVLK